VLLDARQDRSGMTKVLVVNVLILKIPLNLPFTLKGTRKKGEDSGCKPEPAKKLLL